MSARVLANNAIWSALCHIMTRGSLMLAAILLARHLDTSSYAAFSYFQLTISMLAAYSAMGLGVAASRSFARVGAEGNDAEVPLVGTLWALSVVFALLATLGVLAAPAAWLSAGLGVSRWMLALGVLVLALQVVPDGAILGLERYRQAAFIAFIAGAATLVGALLAIRFKQPSLAMLAIITSSLLQSVGEALVVIRAVGWRRVANGLRPRLDAISRVLGLSVPMSLVSLMAASGGWVVGRVILRGPGGQHEFALFSIGLQWFALALFLPGMVSRVVLPMLVRAAAGGATGETSRCLVRKALLLTTGTAATIALLGVVAAPWILRLYGHRYHAGGALIAAYLAAGVVSAPANVLGHAIVAREGQWRWLGVTVVWSVVLLVSAYVLRTAGAWGGGATYVLAYGTMTCAAFLTARRDALV